MKLSLFFAVITFTGASGYAESITLTTKVTSTTRTTPITEMKSFSVTRAIETATPTASPPRILTTRRSMATTKARATGTSLATTKAQTNTNFTTETSTNFTTAISNGTSTPRRREYGTFVDRIGCVYRVFQAHKKLYLSNCFALCPGQAYIVPNTIPCLQLVNSAEERGRNSSRICRWGICVYGTCIAGTKTTKCRSPKRRRRRGRNIVPRFGFIENFGMKDHFEN
ncbi:uncharacterized protein [Dermacentor andersoni]|uniref:uncharacterized protein isoform X2 n=1 Tax=Dermacentor andersoni TaxID=34620 RepID=UPI002416C42B|nr:uncharacterized protein LOC126529321 isoform X2 [Dermacentor andersoni]